MSHKEKPHEQRKKLIVYGMLSLIVLYAIGYGVAFAIGPSHMGDDVSYSFSAHYVSIGTFMQTAGDILTLRILNILPIGLFYFLFGAGVLSSAAWGITSFALSAVLVFLIGKEIYNEYVGLLASFLFSFFPLIAIYSTTMSDNIPMMLFVNLCIYALIKGMKGKSRAWYFVSGAAAMAAPLTTPQGFILWVILAVYLLIELLRRKISINKVTLFLVAGFLIALGATLLFNYINAKAPLITFTANAKYYSQTYRPDLIPLPLGEALSFYPGVMFPYNNAGLNLLSSDTSGGNTTGFFFYLLIIAAAYLIVKRDKHSYLPILWIVVGMLYLEFGPQHFSISPFSYVLSHRLDRYLAMIAAPLALLISAAFVKFVTSSSDKEERYIKISLSAVVLAFLLYTSLQIIVFQHNVASAERYPQLQAADYLNKLPNTTNIYLDPGYGDLTTFMHFNNTQRFWYDYGGATNCTGIPSGAYVLLPRYNHNPLDSCTSSWQLILFPQLTNYSSTAASFASPFVTNLYYVPAVTNKTSGK
ncbi:MAG: glycosyltransferase family 39 protein [Candidatus Micrarchaeota archaeon]|nr:glycosyltransferase family 39 protein [Candidatus Micrarchaeota archaeon]